MELDKIPFHKTIYIRILELDPFSLLPIPSSRYEFLSLVRFPPRLDPPFNFQPVAWIAFAAKVVGTGS